MARQSLLGHNRIMAPSPAERDELLKGFARALFKGGIYDRKARSFVTIDRLMKEIGVEVEPPPLSADVEAFLKADEAIRAGAAMNG